MFGLFKKKDPRAALERRYRQLLEEAHRLGHVDRKASDLKRAEAEEVLAEIERSGQARK
ncbi:MAG: Lacal_2735 family protein [Flavobacteriales bacterium]|nr:Lacal_2735 family protein [Flavobacteriales bacterium]